MRIIIPLLLVCLCSGLAFAQAPTNISLSIAELSSVLESTEKAEDSLSLYVQMGETLYKSSLGDSTGIYYYQKALALTQGIRDPKTKIKNYEKIGRLLMAQGQYDSALACLEEGLEYAYQREKEYPEGVGYMLAPFYKYYYYQVDYKKALEYGLLLKARYENTDKYDLFTAGCTNAGNAYYYLGDYQNALVSYLPAIKLYEEGKTNAYHVYGYIANVYTILKQDDKVAEMLQKNLTAAIKDGDERKIAIVYYKLSRVSMVNGEMETALDYALKSIEINNKQFPTELLYGYIFSSASFSHLERYPEALEHAFLAKEILKIAPDLGQEAELGNSIGNLYLKMKDYANAQESYAKSLEIAEEKGFIHLQMRDHLEIAKIQNKNGNHADAYANLEKHMALKDSMFTKEKNLQVSELQTKYETDKKDLENANLKETNKLIQTRNKQYLIGGTILGGLFLLSGFFFLQLRKIKDKLSIQNEIIADKNKELTELDKVKSNFFANVSHELRTPLTLILGPLSKMLKSKNINNTEFTMLKIMEQNGQGLLKLTNEILDLTKLEARKLELNEKPIVLYLFLRRLLSNFETHAERSAINFSYESQMRPELQVIVDPNKLEKIVNNLISNACKFTPKGGSVTLEVQDLGHSLEIKIKDSGRGIHPDDLPHIFNRFYQTKQADAAAEGGTGIGLALVNEYVKLFKGTIKAESVLQKGSVFTFQFPKKEVLKSLESDEAVATAELSNENEHKLLGIGGVNGKREEVKEAKERFFEKKDVVSTQNEKPKSSILLVEDNYDLREYIQLLLNEQYIIHTAENGQVALDWLNSRKDTKDYPGLIISDVMMPIMDGMQLLANLKKEDRFCGIPVIMLTAKAALPDKLDALRIGVDDYMTKPFVEEELLLRVANLLKNAKSKKAYVPEEEEVSSLEKGNAIVEDAQEVVKAAKVISQQDLEWLAEVEQKVLESLSDFDFTLERLSHEIFLSDRQIRRRLKQFTGLSFKQYLREVRFAEARRLLESGEVGSVKELAYEVGMRDSKYFSKEFKGHFGKSPSEYL